jgi:hypothetical protein
MSDGFKLPAFGSTPPDKPEIVEMPIVMIENPHFGKPFLTTFEAIDAIHFLSEKLIAAERRKEGS